MDWVRWADGGSVRAAPPRWSCSVKSSWKGFPVIPDTYAKVLRNSETHRRETVFQRWNKQSQQIISWTFAVLDLIFWINTCSFRFEKTMSVVFPVAPLPSVYNGDPPFRVFLYGFSGHSIEQVSSRKKLLHFAFTNTLDIIQFHWVHCTNCHTMHV